MDEEQLLARLTLVDDMSDKLLDIANAGMDMTSKLEQMSDTTNAAFNSVSEQASRSVSAAEELSSAMNGLNNSSMSAANGADYWTSAVGNYDKSALEAVFTTEQLIEQGYKTVDAFFDEGDSAERASAAMEKLAVGTESASIVHDALSDMLNKSNQLLENDAQASKLSADARLSFTQANEEATAAMKELEEAEINANEAFKNFEKTASAADHGKVSLDEATAALEAAEQAANKLSAAQQRANEAASDLAKETNNATKSIKDFGDESEENSKKASEALTAISETVAAVKIAEWAKNAASAIYDLTEAFSEAEKTVVNATGATGETLEGLENSMMSAFGEHHADLNSTAGAIGEINTRMALTGDALTDVTGKFLDFSSITGSDVVGSVQNVTKVMNKWNVEQSDVVSVLDKLAYAGQISGASVDSLSSQLINGASSFQAMGLSLDTTISLLSTFELQGINSGTAIMGLKTAVKNFSDDGLNAADALRDTVEQISNMGSEAEATSLAIDVFGSRAGVEFANAIRNGAITVEMLSGDLSVAEGTLQRTANASETLGEKWDKANNKITTAITNSLQPTIDGISGKLSELFGSVGDFLGEHPAAVKVIGAFAAGLGAVTVIFAGYTTAVNLAIPAVEAFSKALSANPIGKWVTIATTAITIITALAVAFSDSSDSVEDYDGTLEECSKEIENTRLAHEKAVTMYGAESAAAKELEGQLDTLNKQYQKGGGAIADYANRAEENARVIRETTEKYSTQIKAIDDANITGQAAVAMLASISEQSTITNADLDLMSQYASYLNDNFECNIKVNYDTKSLTGFDPNNINDILASQTMANRRQAAIDMITSDSTVGQYAKFLTDYENAKRDFESSLNYAIVSDPAFDAHSAGASEALRNYQSAEQNVKNLKAEYDNFADSIREWGEQAGLSSTQIDKQIKLLDDLAHGVDVTAESYEQSSEKIATVADAYKRNINSMADYKAMQSDIADLEKGAISSALQEQSEMLMQVAQKYDEVYASAYESLSGQFGLFEKAKDRYQEVLDPFNQENESNYSGASGVLQARLDALNSQIESMEELNSAVKTLSDSTYDDIMMTEQMSQQVYINSASDAAAYQQETLSMWDDYKDDMLSKIAAGDKEAQAELVAVSAALKNGQTDVVTEIVGKWDELQQNTQETASGISEEVADVQQAMALTQMVIATSLVTIGLDSISAYNAASNVVAGLASGIDSGYALLSQKVSMVESLMSRLSNLSVSVPTVNSASDAALRLSGQYATGTLDAAPGLALVGENGPELVNFGGGEVVYTAEETKQILSQQNDPSVYIPQNIDQALDISKKLSAIKSDNSFIILPEHKETSRNASVPGTSAQEKRIVIDINGAGKIEVSGDADREAILEVLQTNLKPVLLGIINEEIYEEGDGNYEY